MSNINRLEIEGLKDVFLSSHPLEQIKDGQDTRTQVDEFIEEIKQKGVGTIVVLLPSHELHDLYGDVDLLAEYEQHQLEVVHFPLENFSVPDKIELFDQLISRLVEILRDRNLLIHCMAGCGRTGMVAAGVLVRLGSSATAAIEQVRDSRPGSMDVLKQILFLRSYQRFLHGES
ncbi:MAG: fused DSP-PTPase phosphatase/NAD kinase-like protein [bacterium]